MNVLNVTNTGVDMVTPEQLDLVSTYDLIFALQRRYTNTIFMGLKYTGPRGWETKRRHSGDPFTSAGMADNMAQFMHQLINVIERPTDGQGT